MKEHRRVTVAAVLATGAFLVLLGVHPWPVSRLFAIYVLVLAALALSSLTRVVQQRDDPLLWSRFDALLRARAERPGRPPELIRTERELTLGSASAGQLHTRLLPLLRDAAAARMLVGHNVDLHRRPRAARELLGDEAWELLRPDRPAPGDRNAPGPSLQRLARVVERIESL